MEGTEGDVTLKGLGILMVVVLCGAGSLRANLVTFKIGTSHFADNTTVGTAAFNTAVLGQPAPFDQFYGSDINGPNFNKSWTYSEPVITDTITGATFSIGIDDSDAAAAGDQVASFLLGGSDLTAALNSAFNSHGGANGKYNIYSITLPGSTFSALAAGNPTLSLALQNGAGVLGLTPFNGAGIDFSEIDITTQPAATVPEPGVLPLLLAGIGAIAGRRLLMRRA
jgi:hypothetical protein